ncbi:MAG TPA: sulfatase, partial [Polyangiaceae bacterium]|nr:sulfatase [Polyangiaceae bacterium]
FLATYPELLQGRLAGPVSVGVLLIAAVAPWSLRSESSELQLIARGRVLPAVLAVLQRATDLDGDGASAWFGGRDCAPFDRSRNPGAQEIPGNHIDEDCDGKDEGTSATRQLAPTYSFWKAARNPPNVIWYVVDSLRFDHLKTYGYPFETAPALSEFAAESLVFESAFSQSSTTALSIPSMLSGRNPEQMLFDAGGFPRARPGQFYVQSVFGRNGFLTGLIINDWTRQNLPGIQHEFQRVLSAPPEHNWRSADHAVLQLIDFITVAKSERRPFFAVLHVDDVHHPYLSAQGKAVQSFPAPGEVGRYDSGIAVFDQSFRIAIEYLKRSGLWDDTVIIVTADHGEEFGEHGGTVHSRTCYSEVTHVPLVMRVPRVSARRIKSTVALIDIVPTLLELLDRREEGGALEGQSLLIPALEPSELGSSRPVFCTIFQIADPQRPFFTRAVRKSQWSLFEESRSGALELYDVKSDPGERINLAMEVGLQPILRELRASLARPRSGNLYQITQAAR